MCSLNFRKRNWGLSRRERSLEAISVWDKVGPWLWRVKLEKGDTDHWKLGFRAWVLARVVPCEDVKKVAGNAELKLRNDFLQWRPSVNAARVT